MKWFDVPESPHKTAGRNNLGKLEFHYYFREEQKAYALTITENHDSCSFESTKLFTTRRAMEGHCTDLIIREMKKLERQIARDQAQLDILNSALTGKMKSIEEYLK